MTNGLVGFFGLQTPEDLLLKLHRDYRRLKANPDDSDAAFDFFVTATHIPDWLSRAKRPHTSPSSPRDEALLAVGAHLGNRAKHFTVDRHDAVQHGDFPPNTHSLLVTLSSDEAAALGTRQMSALDLAGRVLNYWSTYLTIPS